MILCLLAGGFVAFDGSVRAEGRATNGTAVSQVDPQASFLSRTGELSIIRLARAV